MVSYDRRWDLLRDTEASFCRCNVATAAAVGSQPVPGLKADGFDQDALPDFLDEARWMGYDPNDTLNDMLRLRKGTTHAWSATQ